MPLSELRQGHQEIDRLLAASAAVVAIAARAGTTPDPGIGSWTAEAARLRDARERHRLAVADTAEPASLAATGPHIAGMGFEPADPLVTAEGQPRIGIELGTVMDAVSGSVTPTAAAPPVPVAAAPQVGPGVGLGPAAVRLAWHRSGDDRASMPAHDPAALARDPLCP